jgi:hypothetical protein
MAEDTLQRNGQFDLVWRLSQRWKLGRMAVYTKGENLKDLSNHRVMLNFKYGVFFGM